MAAKQGLFDQLAKMPLGSAERVKAEGEWRKRTPFSGVSLNLSEEGGKLRLFDYNGNRIPAVGGTLIVPVDDRGASIWPRMARRARSRPSARR